MKVDVRNATLSDVEEYTKLFHEYISTQVDYLSDKQSDIKNMFENYNFYKRNELYISSNDTLVSLVIDENQKIVGFMELNVDSPNLFFEKKHIYVSNLYLKKEIRTKNIEFPLAKKFITIIEDWAKSLNVKYICNDMFSENRIMKYINRIIGFVPYKIRYVKTL